jgi:hypothetical protein
MIIATISVTCVIIDKNDDRNFGFHEEKYIAVLYQYTRAEVRTIKTHGGNSQGGEKQLCRHQMSQRFPS